MSSEAVMEPLCARGHARKLGHLENYFALAQRQDLYTNFGLFCELDRSFSPRQLAAALRSLCLEHPLLLHTVVEKTGSQSAKELDQADGHLPTGPSNFYQTDEYLSQTWPDHDYIRVLEQVCLQDVLLNGQAEYADVVAQVLAEFARNGGNYSSTVFEPLSHVRIPYSHVSRPNWRVLLFPDGADAGASRHFLFMANHCCSDGTSAANFVHDVRARLRAEDNTDLGPGVGNNPVLFRYSRDHAQLPRLPAPIETNVDYVTPKSYFARMVANQLLREYVGYKSAGPPIQRVSQPHGNQFYSYFLKLSPQQTQHVKARLKHRLHSKCTLTPFMQACWFAALHKSHKVFTHSFSQQLTNIVVAMNTAKLVPHDDAKLVRDYRYGCNVGGSHYNYSISSFDVADDPPALCRLVEYYRDVFQEAQRKRHYLYPLGALMQDSLYESRNVDRAIVSGILGKPRLGTMLSNLGYFPQASDQHQYQYQIRDLIFAQTTGSFRYTFDINCCATDVGGLNLVLCIAEGAVACREDWNQVCELFKSIMLEF